MASLLQEAVERFLVKDSAGKLTKTLNSLYDVVIDPTIKEGLNTKRVFNSTNLENFAKSKRKDITKLTEDQLDDLVSQYADRGLTKAQKEIEKDIGQGFKFSKEQAAEFKARFGNELYDTNFQGLKNLEKDSDLYQYLGEVRAQANPKYLDYYKVQREVLGKEAAGIYDPAQLENLVNGNKWTKAEDARSFFEQLKQAPQPISQPTYASTFPGQENVLKTNRGENRLMYETGLINKQEAIKRNKKVLKDIENENAIKKARIDAANGDPEALNIVNKADGVGETPWAGGMRAALGTAVGGAALLAAINSSRGQQNNAQLYGQQPLY